MSKGGARGGTEANAGRAGSLEAVPRLTAVSGPAKGRALAVSGAHATVGRHSSNDLVLEDPRVSGVHLDLWRVAGGVRVRDAGSTNGTWLGPHRVGEVELAPGGELTVGGTLLRLDVDEAATPAAVSAAESFGGLVGRSIGMRELFATLDRVAPKNLSVLIQGETGTGKEEVARAIHARSGRATGPFVVIDATALPATIAESLLLGHEEGAFPGAEHRSAGLFEAADGGTVFLDEIGELPASIQAMLLRVLEERAVTRVGGHVPTAIDVRVLSSSHRDLRHEMEAGRFREDLFFRLAQLRLTLPPLRDRPEDIPILCQALLGRLLERGESPVHIEADAYVQLAAQPWPGNVRELYNVLARAAALANDGMIRRTDVAGEGFGFRGTREERSVLDLSGTFASAKGRAIARLEAAYLAALMKRTQGNLSLASREADLARHHLRDLLKKHNLYGVSWGQEP